MSKAQIVVVGQTTASAGVLLPQISLTWSTLPVKLGVGALTALVALVLTWEFRIFGFERARGVLAACALVGIQIAMVVFLVLQRPWWVVLMVMATMAYSAYLVKRALTGR